jgi:hypothetical protein
VLIRWWHQCRRGRPHANIQPDEVARWGKALAEFYKTDAIATPVFIEMIAGTMDGRELSLTRTYLDCFHCVDERQVPPADWKKAIRLASRVPRKARPRDLGDCLIRAIADRLNYDVITHDTGFTG